MHYVHALYIGGANLRCEIDVLEIILQSSTHALRLGGLDELRQERAEFWLVGSV